MRLADPPLSRLESFRQETTDLLSEAVVEREQQLVRNVVLLGPQSRNGYRYTREAMEAAVPLYHERPIFLDHAQSPAIPTQRTLRDFAGQILQPRLEGERLRGDLRLVGPHTSWLFDLIHAAPRDVGMSHVVLGRRAHDGQAVEHIERVISVDIVAFPATTTSFQEQDAVPDWVRRLLEQSSLPQALRTDGLLQALTIHPEPGRLVQALEQFAEQLQQDHPQSCSKPNSFYSPANSWPSNNSWKSAVLSAIKGIPVPMKS